VNTGDSPAAPTHNAVSPRVVVVAPDSFKGSATAAEAARAIAAGWAQESPLDRIILKPMADGGEGTADAFATAFSDATFVPVTVRGPDDSPVSTSWLHLPSGSFGGTAVIELANTSGITLLDPLSPMRAHTYGFGEAIASALEAGVSRLILAIGGSASTDGGSGMLAALGARFSDARGNPVPLGGGGLADLATVDLTNLAALPAEGVVVLTDVTNPLLGPSGSAAVYGPQKGASPAEVVELERNLQHFSTLATAALGTAALGAGAAGAGAAGGTGFGLALWGASLQSGATTISELVGLAAALDRADIVITGEGRFDEQSAQGKVPSVVLELVNRSAADAYLVAGSIAAATDSFAATRSLTDLAGSSEAARADAARWLHQAGADLARARTSFTAYS
jgi:glycerate kinase